MKVGVWLKPTYRPEAGGGYSYYDLLIEQIDQYEFNKGIEICFISESIFDSLKFKKPVLPLLPRQTIPFLYWVLGKTSYLIPKIGYKIRRYIDTNVRFQSKRTFDLLRNNKIDLIYYPIQAYCKIKNFPFIINNWDLGHITSFAFPEMTMNGEFESREYFYKRILPKAIYVFAESESGKSELVKYLNIPERKVKIVPLFPSKVVFENISEEKELKILNKFRLVHQQYFFYPAQFWPHKNHYGLLMAYKEVQRLHPEIKLVLCGGDKGNHIYIKEVIKKLNLSNVILDLGFIENRILHTLYKHAIALVMPTYVGPTNMPLLEALLLNCPVLCSDIEGHREMLNDAALYFPPESSGCIADSMFTILDMEQRDNLLKKAERRKNEVNFDVNSSVEKIEHNLLEILPVRSCWG